MFTGQTLSGGQGEAPGRFWAEQWCHQVCLLQRALAGNPLFPASLFPAGLALWWMATSYSLVGAENPVNGLSSFSYRTSSPSTDSLALPSKHIKNLTTRHHLPSFSGPCSHISPVLPRSLCAPVTPLPFSLFAMQQLEYVVKTSQMRSLLCQKPLGPHIPLSEMLKGSP